MARGKKSVSMNLKGGKELQRKLRKIAKRFPEAAGDALYLEANDIMTESKKEVPVDTGRLRNTGFVKPDRSMSMMPVVHLGYNTKYAPRQHEETTWKHPVGKSKYLEDPIRRWRTTGTLKLARTMRERIRVRGSKPQGDHPKHPPEE